MIINGKTKICGVIGCPIEHTMSPLMHNLYAEQTDINLTYVPFRVEQGHVGDAVYGAHALNIQGINVTVPHKQTVMEYLADIDTDAKVIGAVNTLVRTEEGYKGYNTDADGLYRAMRRQGIIIAGEACILLGAGGAAKAAAYLLAREGAREIYILNRSMERGVCLADEINTWMKRTVVQAFALSDWRSLPEQRYLSVQTTSVGMHPAAAAAPIEDEEFYQLIHTAVDIIYTPMETRFMQLAAAQGAKTMNGLDMLIYQGIIAYELWNPDQRISEQTTEQARLLMQEHLGGKR